MRWAYFLPVWFRYHDVPDPKAGWFWGFLFFMMVGIDNDYLEDEGLFEHEMTHARQHVRTLFLHPLLYRLSKKYRLNAELEAYCHQLKFYPEDQRSALIWKFGEYISEWYDLDIDKSEAAAMLSEKFYIKG